ncbi:hypothetical protein QUB63_20025 [Microcoleus sp. ARI1-B5]
MDIADEAAADITILDFRLGKDSAVSGFGVGKAVAFFFEIGMR